MRSVLALAAAGVAQLCATHGALAEPRRVTIQVPAKADALLDEALVRVRGELFAMGLEAEIQTAGTSPIHPAANPSLEGRLILERDGSWIRIRALGPSSATPAFQELDTRRADVTAEVVAVRAVEALRAMMSSLPEPRAAKPAAAPAPPRVQAPPPVSAPPRVAVSLAPRDKGALSVWLGPTFLYDVPRRTSLAAELGVFWGRSAWFGGVQLGTSLLRAELDDPAGQVYVRRSSALARFGLTFQLSPANELWFVVGSGLARYGVHGEAAPGYVSASGHHTTLLLAGGVGATSWFSSLMGAYLQLDTTFAARAASVHVTAQEIAVLERPTVTAGLGLSLRTH
jgi:hypothetical protein